MSKQLKDELDATLKLINCITKEGVETIRTLNQGVQKATNEQLLLLQEELKQFDKYYEDLQNHKQDAIILQKKLQQQKPWLFGERLKLLFFIKSIEREIRKLIYKKNIIEKEKTALVSRIESINSTHDISVDISKYVNIDKSIDLLSKFFGTSLQYYDKVSQIFDKNSSQMNIALEIENLETEFMSIPVIQLIDSTRHDLAELLTKHHKISLTNNHSEIYKTAQEYGYIRKADRFDMFEIYRNWLAHQTKRDKKQYSHESIYHRLWIGACLHDYMMTEYLFYISHCLVACYETRAFEIVSPDNVLNNRLTKLMYIIDQFKQYALQTPNVNKNKYLNVLTTILPEEDIKTVKRWLNIRNSVAHGHSVSEQSLPQDDDLKELESILTTVMNNSVHNPR